MVSLNLDLILLGPEEVYNYYQGIDENNALQFDQDWNQTAKAVNYSSQFGKPVKTLQGLPGFDERGQAGDQLALGNGSSYGGQRDSVNFGGDIYNSMRPSQRVSNQPAHQIRQPPNNPRRATGYPQRPYRR